MFFKVLQEAKEKAEVESLQNNDVEVKKGYAYLLDSFQGILYLYIFHVFVILKLQKEYSFKNV